MYFTWWQLLWAIVGAFGTAFMHQHVGRDPRTGGLIGLVLGGLFGPFSLVTFWIWLYYTRQNVHVIKTYRKWYEWWRP